MAGPCTSSWRAWVNAGTPWPLCLQGPVLLAHCLFSTANQFIQLLRDVVAIPAGWASPDQHFITFDLVASSLVAILVSLVIAGRIERIGRLTVRSRALNGAVVSLYDRFCLVHLCG